MKKIFIISLFLMITASGCVAGGKLYRSALLEEKRLEVDKNRGADMCTPYDFAMAESNVEFAKLELEAGNHYRAEEHLTSKDLYATKASLKADSCILKDTDGDKIPDIKDKCPKDSGLLEFEGCPPAIDRDGDAIPDSNDRCPDDKGFAEFKGCPDRDGDGIADIDDKCPDVKGTKELLGCLPATDRDEDTIPDSEDRCPDDKGIVELKGCPDRDADKIADLDDKCPDAKGLKELFGCPLAADRDGDTIPDSEDRCPDDKGIVELKGCPDRDADKIADLDDKCPDVAGVPELSGCPKIVDKDGDGINDDEDKCPEVPGIKEENGCPKKYKLIVVTAKKIELKQIVYFQSGKAVIERKSYEMLKEVADALKNASSVKKVIIEGHTDNIGGRNLNISLSQKRAEAVKEFLIDEGVSSSKLEAKGYGPDKPIAPNKTNAGKAKNRRVEFILEQ